METSHDSLLLLLTASPQSTPPRSTSCCGALFAFACDDTSKEETSKTDITETSPDFRPIDFGQETEADLEEDLEETGQSDLLGPCEVGETQCAGKDAMLICENGEFVEQPCFLGDVCHPDTGICGAPLCPIPGLAFQCEDESHERICGDDQLSYTVEACVGEESCSVSGCANRICNPFERRCTSNLEHVEMCNEEGTGFDIFETCRETQSCSSSGYCTEPL